MLNMKKKVVDYNSEQLIDYWQKSIELYRERLKIGLLSNDSSECAHSATMIVSLTHWIAEKILLALSHNN